jgi:hypothetical protein
MLTQRMRSYSSLLEAISAIRNLPCCGDKEPTLHDT